MDRRDHRKRQTRLSGSHEIAGADPLAEELLDAFVRLARGDLSVRVARNYQRDAADTLAYFVNLIAEEMGRLLDESERNRKRLEEGVSELNDLFRRLAGGDFSVRTNRTSDGDPLNVLGSLFDSTVAEVGELFGEVDRQRATLEAIFDSMADAVFLLDSSARIERANGAASRLFGRSVSELEGMDFAELLSVRETAFGYSLCGDTLTEPFRARDTYFIDARDEPFFLVVSGSPLVGADGQRRGVVITARDERELRKTQAQLQLSDRMATMGTLAAGVAHEINNPLAFVISNLEFALEEIDALPTGAALPDELREEMVRALGTSKDGAERVAQIVRELKSISRVDEDTERKVDVRRVLDSAVTMLRNDIRHRARLVKDFGHAPCVIANEARLMQVMLNLIKNAAQSIPVGHAADNQIRLETRLAGNGEAVISVMDTGAGIPAEHLGRIFDAFYSTKDVGVGTGIGLSICHRLVTQMGGRIEVESEPGEGSTFRVCLPAASSSSDETPTVRARRPLKQVRRRVLVVDDEREIGESVRRLLGPEHDVDLALSGSQALALFARRPYDLVLIDIMMPEMSGLELRTALHAQSPEHGTRVVLMSGGSLDAAAGTDAHIEKPFSPAVLRGLVDELGDRD